MRRAKLGRNCGRVGSRCAIAAEERDEGLGGVACGGWSEGMKRWGHDHHRIER